MKFFRGYTRAIKKEFSNPIKKGNNAKDRLRISRNENLIKPEIQNKYFAIKNKLFTPIKKRRK